MHDFKETAILELIDLVSPKLKSINENFQKLSKIVEKNNRNLKSFQSAINNLKIGNLDRRIFKIVENINSLSTGLKSIKRLSTFEKMSKDVKSLNSQLKSMHDINRKLIGDNLKLTSIVERGEAEESKRIGKKRGFFNRHASGIFNYTMGMLTYGAVHGVVNSVRHRWHEAESSYASGTFLRGSSEDSRRFIYNARVASQGTLPVQTAINIYNLVARNLRKNPEAASKLAQILGNVYSTIYAMQGSREAAENGTDFIASTMTIKANNDPNYIDKGYYERDVKSLLYSLLEDKVTVKPRVIQSIGKLISPYMRQMNSTDMATLVQIAGRNGSRAGTNLSWVLGTFTGKRVSRTTRGVLQKYGILDSNGRVILTEKEKRARDNGEGLFRVTYLELAKYIRNYNRTHNIKDNDYTQAILALGGGMQMSRGLFDFIQNFHLDYARGQDARQSSEKVNYGKVINSSPSFIWSNASNALTSGIANFSVGFARGFNKLGITLTKSFVWLSDLLGNLGNYLGDVIDKLQTKNPYLTYGAVGGLAAFSLYKGAKWGWNTFGFGALKNAASKQTTAAFRLMEAATALKESAVALFGGRNNTKSGGSPGVILDNEMRDSKTGRFRQRGKNFLEKGLKSKNIFKRNFYKALGTGLIGGGIVLEKFKNTRLGKVGKYISKPSALIKSGIKGIGISLAADQLTDFVINSIDNDISKKQENADIIKNPEEKKKIIQKISRESFYSGLLKSISANSSAGLWAGIAASAVGVGELTGGVGTLGLAGVGALAGGAIGATEYIWKNSHLLQHDKKESTVSAVTKDVASGLQQSIDSLMHAVSTLSHDIRTTFG